MASKSNGPLQRQCLLLLSRSDSFVCMHKGADRLTMAGSSCSLSTESWGVFDTKLLRSCKDDLLVLFRQTIGASLPNDIQVISSEPHQAVHVAISCAVECCVVLLQA